MGNGKNIRHETSRRAAQSARAKLDNRCVLLRDYSQGQDNTPFSNTSGNKVHVRVLAAVDVIVDVTDLTHEQTLNLITRQAAARGLQFSHIDVLDTKGEVSGMSVGEKLMTECCRGEFTC